MNNKLQTNLMTLNMRQWNDIGKRVTSGHAEMDDKEWQNVQVSLADLNLFIRQP